MSDDSDGDDVVEAHVLQKALLEMQRKESTETHFSRNKIQTTVVNTEEKNARKHEIFYQQSSLSVQKNHES